MSNEIISRDENFRTVGAGVTDDVAQDITMLRVDSATKRLLCSLNFNATSNANGGSIASRDENHRTVCLGYDDTNNVLHEILTDENGYILCDVVVE